MAADVRVRGAEQFRALARDLRAAGHQQLVKDLTAGLKGTAKPITVATRQRALATLPRSGGLARLVARSPQRVVARAGKTTATVAVVVPGKRKGSGASQADAGTVRHPTYGHRPFVAQRVSPGWFSDTAEGRAKQVQAALLDVMDTIARRAGFR